MRDFEILFDHGEPSELPDESFASYGQLGFPAPPPERPWIFANFVQTVDGVVSLLGANPSGSDISQSPEDRWLMDLLRAHADAILLGMGTLRAETALARPGPRGPVFRITDPALRQLREKLRRGRERNIFLTASGDIDFERYAAFDGETVDPFLLTTAGAAAKMGPRLRERPQIQVIVCGQESGGPANAAAASGGAEVVDLERAMRLLRQQYGIRYLLCEGGPTMYSNMLLHDLVDEKFLTVSPLEVGLQVPEPAGGPTDYGESPLNYPTLATKARVGHPSPLGVPLRPTAFTLGGLTKERAVHWQWLSCRKVGDHQFHRLRRRRQLR
ncbi:MAG: dihydrofolate reductase family protein [Candidatus Korobacteraceae bacterium]